MKRAVFGELAQNQTSSEALSHDSKGKNGLEVQMSKGSENKQSLLNSEKSLARDAVCQPQLMESTTQNYKQRLDT